MAAKPPKPITEPQARALLALDAAGASAVGRYVEAQEVGVSGAALAALARRGLAQTSSALARQHGWSAAAYRLTWDGHMAVRTLRREAARAESAAPETTPDAEPTEYPEPTPTPATDPALPHQFSAGGVTVGVSRDDVLAGTYRREAPEVVPGGLYVVVRGNKRVPVRWALVRALQHVARTQPDARLPSLNAKVLRNTTAYRTLLALGFRVGKQPH